MPTQLTYDEFISTMTTKMVDVTNTVEPKIDIWSYVQHLNNDNLVLDHVHENQIVEMIYRNSEHSFDHVLLPTDNPNVFIVIVVDLIQSKIKGHFKLDLEKEYGIK